MTLLACSAGVFLASERSVLLRVMCGRHLGFSKQRKVGREQYFYQGGDQLSPCTRLPKSNMAARKTIATILSFYKIQAEITNQTQNTSRSSNNLLYLGQRAKDQETLTSTVLGCTMHSSLLGILDNYFPKRKYQRSDHTVQADSY